ncbi:sporulation membrane protein YtaF [Bacillus cytotoxicus]|uniref:Sporulation protein YtaF n=2 Tax=Bacillus cytotoxicus TaxID=580165 RepID=A0AAX2CLP6_9BACI|nr:MULTISPECIES: sporulation membrane protein YtaF [Bacillus cereus group]ABS23489.1 Sporulation protein YtaF [Bacillus cytotoxicus NVH 391-98]AWC30093.1 sporulation membrane protein YtaF [Bacillus cytotoxicus]AWC34139.1 sporulation membrane protein YtaF [Bacillus cytotoxicus]AWC38136.1 sporulation membrane protein YtaF [Bacillus cytotoxicus]AWC42230.1 sporulation membrane protein YtaF [Bacillus cytotoxicus]
MSLYFSLILLAFTLSLDSCSVGLTYGLRNVRIPLRSIIIIGICSAAVMLVSMGIGNMIAKVFSPMIATRIGGFVLVGIGAWVLYQFFRGDKKEEIKQEEKVWKLEIASLGLVIQILRKPTVADFDRSGTISAGEALLLGIALSVDSFGAGIGASLLGYAPVMMAMLVAVMSSLFLFIGMQMGTMLSNMRWLQRFTFLPGVLLIIIGLWKI